VLIIAEVAKKARVILALYLTEVLMQPKKGFLLCVCQGTCPSFHSMNVFEVLNELRKDKIFDFVALHPQLCADDGDEFLKTLLSNKNIDEIYIAGCDPRMQQKMFKDAIKEAQFDNLKHHAVDIRNMDTTSAIQAIKNLANEKVQ
jgi:heterodisulfide reductase subunit A-like polyferredoxin